MAKRRYWVVSPNVGDYEGTVEGWTSLIMERSVAIMGYGPEERTGKKKRGCTGPKFAGRVEPGVRQGDIILIARGRNQRQLVAAGIVASEPTIERVPQLRKQPVQMRRLVALKDLRQVERPSAVQRALGRALPWKGAMRELGDSWQEDRQVKKWLDGILEAGNQHDDESRGGWGPRQPDIEHRHAVEVAAQKAVETRYSNRGYSVTDVSGDKQGYDLIASKRGQTLKVEVKGHSAGASHSELTPNEYRYMHRNDRSYRLCIVSYALYSEPKRQIQEFRFMLRKGGWFDDDRNRLCIRKRMGATVRVAES